MKDKLIKVWASWKHLALHFARFQTALLLTIFYFLFFAPLGLLFRLFGWDPLEAGARNRRKPTNWKPIDQDDPDMDSMRRQS